MGAKGTSQHELNFDRKSNGIEDKISKNELQLQQGSHSFL